MRKLFFGLQESGVVVLASLYFMFDRDGRQNPPAITHPQFYFGFLGVMLAWQFVFFVIAADPLRYRPIITLSVFEKLSYVLAIALPSARAHDALRVGERFARRGPGRVIYPF